MQLKKNSESNRNQIVLVTAGASGIAGQAISVDGHTESLYNIKGELQ